MKFSEQRYTCPLDQVTSPLDQKHALHIKGSQGVMHKKVGQGHLGQARCDPANALGSAPPHHGVLVAQALQKKPLQHQSNRASQQRTFNSVRLLT